MNTIHRKWLEPVPDYWQLWAYRDDDRIGEHPPFVVDAKKAEPRVCDCCGAWYQPLTRRSLFCQKQGCQQERKRRYYARANAKRKKAGAA